jgi:DNA polymerase-1
MRCHLVDASPYIFRAYFSLPSSLRSPGGQPINAVYGFASFLLKLREAERVENLAVAFDRSLTSSFRNEMLPSYKAQRELPEAELEAQLDACERLTRSLGIPTLISDRYEAEDLLAGLCRVLVAEGHEVVLVSADKDLMQLVTDQVSLLDFARDERYGPAEVRAKFGVEPVQITDFLGLAGDSVDNIPGVAGVGAKTAAALLAHFGSIEGIYARLDEVAGLPLRGARSIQGKLAAGRAAAELSKRLATLECVPCTAGIEDMALRPASPELAALVEELGFGQLRARLAGW